MHREIQNLTMNHEGTTSTTWHHLLNQLHRICLPQGWALFVFLLLIFIHLFPWVFLPAWCIMNSHVLLNVNGKLCWVVFFCFWSQTWDCTPLVTRCQICVNHRLVFAVCLTARVVEAPCELVFVLLGAAQRCKSRVVVTLVLLEPDSLTPRPRPTAIHRPLLVSVWYVVWADINKPVSFPFMLNKAGET